jgi:hypothetical protein
MTLTKIGWIGLIVFLISVLWAGVGSRITGREKKASTMNKYSRECFEVCLRAEKFYSEHKIMPTNISQLVTPAWIGPNMRSAELFLADYSLAFAYAEVRLSQNETNVPVIRLRPNVFSPDSRALVGFIKPVAIRWVPIADYAEVFEKSSAAPQP